MRMYRTAWFSRARRISSGWNRDTGSLRVCVVHAALDPRSPTCRAGTGDAGAASKKASRRSDRHRPVRDRPHRTWPRACSSPLPSELSEALPRSKSTAGQNPTQRLAAREPVFRSETIRNAEMKFSRRGAITDAEGKICPIVKLLGRASIHLSLGGAQVAQGRHLRTDGRVTAGAARGAAIARFATGARVPLTRKHGWRRECPRPRDT
jgi:hypothetical protein